MRFELGDYRSGQARFRRWGKVEAGVFCPSANYEGLSLDETRTHHNNVGPSTSCWVPITHHLRWKALSKKQNL